MLFKFIAGNKIDHVLKVGLNLYNKNRIPIINYISENSNNENKLKNYNEYNRLIDAIDKKYIIALKLSSFNFDENLINNLIKKTNEKNIKLIIDAEENNNFKKYQNITNNLILKNNINQRKIIKTYQMYRKDSLSELSKDIINSYANNIKIYPKLVRGAYFYSEYSEDHLFNNKEDTDNNYNKAILLCYKNNIKTILATHNNFSINLANTLNNDKDLFIFANLLGMNENKIDKIKNYSKATYIPYGPYHEMIPYLIRRLHENIDSIKYIFK